jgi:hypothetical protein
MRYQQKTMRRYGKMKGENGLRRTMLMAKRVFGKEEACKRVSTLIGLPSVTEGDITRVPDIFERGDLRC